MQLDNSLELSNLALREWRPRRYVSAEHAVDQYLRMRSLMGGEKAMDYQKISLRVQTSPAPENPALDAVDDIVELEAAMGTIKGRVSTGEWTAWCAIRVFRKSLREVSGCSKSTAERRREKVDGLLEEELARRGMLVRHNVRLDAQRYLA